MALPGDVNRAVLARSRRTGLLGASVVSVGALAIAVVAAVVRSDANPTTSVSWLEPAWLPMVETVTAALIVAGCWAAYSRYPLATNSFAVAAAGSLLPLLAAWNWLPSAIRVGATAAAPLVVAGVVGVAVAIASVSSASVSPASVSPAGAAQPARRHRGVWSVYLFSTAACVVHLLGYNAFADPGCLRTCNDIRPVLESVMTTVEAIELSFVLTAIAAVLGLALVVRLPIPTELRAATLAALTLGLTSACLGWWYRNHPTPISWRIALDPLAVALLGVGLCYVAVRAWRSRIAVEHLVNRLAGAQPLGGRPGVVSGILFALPDGTGWVDAGGNRSAHPVSDDCVLVADPSPPEVRLLLARPSDADTLRASLTPATRLALTNAALAAIAGAQLLDLRSSQRRIVAVSDAERRRIERDLHDGAQQRLVSVAIAIRLAMARADPTEAKTLTDVENLVGDALAHLRDLANGSLPTALTDEGLSVAIDDLVAATNVAAAADIRVPNEISVDVASAIFVTIAAALGSITHPTATSEVQISVVQGKGSITARANIISGGAAVAPDFVEATDRVGAADGSLLVSQGPSGEIVVSVVIPCG